MQIYIEFSEKVMWQCTICQLDSYEIDLTQKIVKCVNCLNVSPLDGRVESVTVSAPPVSGISQGKEH